MMHRALILSVLLFACRNQETNDRLARVEKEARPTPTEPARGEGVRPSPNTSPLTTGAPETAPTFYAFDRKVAAAIGNNPDGVGRFVATSRDPEEGFVFHEQSGVTPLFRLHASTRQYFPITTVLSILGPDGEVAITDEMKANM